MKHLPRMMVPVMLAFLLAACDSGSRSGSSTTTTTTTQADSSAQSGSAVASTASDSGAQKGPNPRFYDVTKRLDQGGSFYMYADVKDVLRDFVKDLEPLLEEGEPDAKQILAKADQALEQYGLYGIQDVGLSSLPEANGQYINKVFLSMPGGVKGVPALLGQSPHKIEGLAYAPPTTRLFVETDLEFEQLLTTVRDLVSRFGGPEALNEFNQSLSETDMKLGVNTEQIMKSLGNRVTVIVDQDPAQMLTVQQIGLEMNAPRVAFMLTVKDETLYKTLVEKAQLQGLTGPEQTTQGLTVTPLMAPPNPFYPVAPVIAGNKERLIISTHADLVFSMMQAQTTSGLADTEEFKQLSAGLPADGNGLIFVSKSLFDAVRQVMTVISDKMKEEEGVNPLAMQISKIPKTGTYNIRRHEADGIMFYSRANSGAGQAVATVAVVPVAGMLAAIAVPNFLEAKGRSSVARSMADMRSMAVAIESYYVDCSAYPAYSANVENNFFADYVGDAPELGNVPTFRLKNPPNLYILTSPISYMTSYIPDPFAPAKGATYGYYSTATGWIIWSPGPDKKYDINSSNVNRIYQPEGQLPSPELIELTYDPTNGSVSPGDVYRYKQ